MLYSGIAAEISNMETEKKDSTSQRSFGLFHDGLDTIRTLFNLKADTDEAGTIEIVRSNVNFRSANAWTLVFAILIASVGLNVNSTAVIIGAMLISPLMGPIVGAGLAMGINDFSLLKRALKNLGYAVIISILTSAAYFLITPLSEVQSELLARTQPTFFDVLIALFGGAAGIIALSRKERGNVIPGVAIATALMPPLCTAGFGLATAEPKYFVGALYLFIINSVFIFIATYVFTRYMGFKKVSTLEETREKLIHRWVAVVAIIVIVPSLILVWMLQQESAFRARALNFINREMRFPNSFIVSREIIYDWRKQKIMIEMIGEALTKEQLDLVNEKLKRYYIDPSILEIRHISFEENLEKRLTEKINTESALVAELRAQSAQREIEIKRLKEATELSSKLTLEATTVMPDIRRIILADIPLENSESARFIYVVWKKAPKKSERERIQRYLEQRLQKQDLEVYHSQEI